MSDSELSVPEAPSTDLAIFGDGSFEALQRISTMLVDSALVPETLRGEYKNGKLVPFDEKTVAANVFRVVEQALRWKLSPFAVCDCASIVRGKLQWEGKLIAAVLDAQLGIKLDYEFEGEGEKMKVVVSGTRPGDTEPKTVEGDVATWKTTGKGSPWIPTAYKRQLAYRGARDWARMWAPGPILGVVSDDEELEVVSDSRDATPADSNPFKKQAEPVDAELVEDPPERADGSKAGGANETEKEALDRRTETAAEAEPEPQEERDPRACEKHGIVCCLDCGQEELDLEQRKGRGRK